MKNSTEKQIKRKIGKMNNKQIEARQMALLEQNAIFDERMANLELQHQNLQRIRTTLSLRDELTDEQKRQLGLVIKKLAMIEEEIKRVETLYEKNTALVKLLQEVAASRISGRNDGWRIGGAWLTGLSTAGLAAASLWAGYKTDVNGEMRNKTPLALFDRLFSKLNFRS